MTQTIISPIQVGNEKEVGKKAPKGGKTGGPSQQASVAQLDGQHVPGNGRPSLSQVELELYQPLKVQLILIRKLLIRRKTPMQSAVQQRQQRPL